MQNYHNQCLINIINALDWILSQFQAYYGYFIPLVVFGAVSGSAALMTIPLPETLHQDLPETLEEGDKMRSKTASREENKLNE